MRDLLDNLPDDLRNRALTHPAFARSHGESFERLEFLGDSVLGLAITHELFRRYPNEPEGELTRLRAAVVSRDSCEIVARAGELGEAMVQRAASEGAAAEANAVRLSKQRNALAALTESVIGAAFLAHGFHAVSDGIVAAFEDRIAHAHDNRIDARSQLQELASQTGAEVTWNESGEDGPPHDRTFTMAVAWERGEEPISRATGSGRSKQEAQQAAAAALLVLVDETQG